jgi:autotransporter-associated beta strand protein
MAMAVNGLNSATDKGDATVQLLNGTLAVNDNVTRGRPGTTGTNGPGSVAFTLGGGTLRPYSRDVNVGITTTGSNLLSFDVTLAANTLSTITGVGWKSGSAHTVTMFSNLVGSGSLQVTGGTVVLNSAGNTYSGATTIAGTNATLRLSAAGSFANSPTIRVGNAGSSGAVLDLTAKTGTFSFGSGQTVGGIGTIRMDAGDTARFAGTFSPGNSPGIFTFDGGTGLLSGTTVIEIFGATRGTGYDGVDLINGASLNYGSGVLALDFGSWLADQQSYQLFGSGSSSLLGSFSSVTIAGTNYAGLTFTNSGGVWTSQGTSPANQTLTFTEATGTLVIVPEPGAIALAGIGIAAAAWALRSRSPSRKRAG